MVDCIEIVVPGETFRLTNSNTEVVFGGRTFYASSVILRPISDFELVVVLAAEDPFSIRFLAGGAPKSQTKVHWERLDDDGGIVRRLDGEIVSAELGHAEVRLHVASSLALALRKPLAVIASRSCQHRLFDAMCRVDRSGFTTLATVVHVEGYEVTVNVALSPDWSVGGEFVHVQTTERTLIAAQRQGRSPVETVLTLQARSYNTRKCDSVQISAGCDREIRTCADKFHNAVNFGGSPYLRDRDPFEH